LVAVTIAGVREALTLGAQAGADPAKIVEVLGAGAASCWMRANRGDRRAQGDFAPGFRIRLRYEDLNIRRQTSKGLAALLTVTAAVHDLFTPAIARGRGGLEHRGLLTVVEELVATEARTGG
jgi:2-hydroxy-3-oxopropionate reductase